MPDNLRHLSVKGVKWSATESFLTQGISFVVGLIIARILSPSDYGTVGMLAVFMAVSQAFVNSGFSSALVRTQDRTADDYATAFYFKRHSWSSVEHLRYRLCDLQYHELFLPSVG